MVRRRRMERERYWRGVIRDQQASGLSISAFCREREVAAASFFSWRRKFADRHAGQREDTEQREETVGKFVPIELPTPPVATGSCYEVVLPDGCRIIVPARFDGASLRDILRALSERPC